MESQVSGFSQLTTMLATHIALNSSFEDATQLLHWYIVDLLSVVPELWIALLLVFIFKIKNLYQTYNKLTLNVYWMD